MSKYDKFYLTSLICCAVVLVAALIMHLVSQNPAVIETSRYLHTLESGYFISLVLSRIYKEKEEHDNTYM